MESHAIKVRVGNRASANSFTTLPISSIEDSPAFKRLVDNAVKSNPEDPLVIVADGYESYLEDIYAASITFHSSSPAVTNREVHFADSVRLPQSADRRAAQVPWTFIVDQMNLPEVWHWTFGRRLPREEHASSIDHYRFRIGAWVCDQGAYVLDARVPVVLLFTRSDHISEDVVTKLIFPHLFQAAQMYDDRAADDAVCWVFYQLYNLLSDWQNIIGEMGRKLNLAETDSQIRDLPVKVRTKRLHKEVDRIYELHDYLRFHSRAFKKLAKFKTTEATKSKHGDNIWEVIDDCLEDLEQYKNYLDSMKERFNNLVELDFNIENATQSSDARFISVLGALFLPVSFVAGIFGFTSVTWKFRYFLYTCLPLFFISIAACYLLPAMITSYENKHHPTHLKRINLRKQDFTMLGNEAPEASDLQHSDTSSDLSQYSPSQRNGHSAQNQSVPKPIRRPSTLPPSPQLRSDAKSTFYGIQRSPGVVGSRRKFLHQGDEARRDHMQFRDFQRDMDRVAQREENSPRPRHDGRSVSRGRPTVDKAFTDGTVECREVSARSRRSVDVERMGSRRRRSGCMS